MPSKRFEEFLKTASPELKSHIADVGKESMTPPDPKPDGIKVHQPNDYSISTPGRRGELRPHAPEPKPFDSPTNEAAPSQQPERRIDQAMTQKQEAKTAQPDKAPPAKEPER
jgi:hypothetical protein